MYVLDIDLKISIQPAVYNIGILHWAGVDYLRALHYGEVYFMYDLFITKVFGNVDNDLWV